MTFWQWVYTYQTLIAGGVGFAGVIGTLFINAWIARRQRREELDHERGILRRALIEELRVHHASLTAQTSAMKSIPYSNNEDVMVPTDPMDHAYRSFFPKIGLLTQEEVAKIMEAYLTLDTYIDSLILLYPASRQNPKYVAVHVRRLADLITMRESLIPPIDAAIEALKQVRNRG